MGGCVSITNKSILEVQLSKRPFRHWFKSVSHNKHLWNAFKLYGREGFVLIIFENMGSKNRVSKEELERAEDRYLALTVLKYNFLEKAFSSEGYKHTEEAISKMRKSRLGKKLSESTKKKLKILFSGAQNPFYGKKHNSTLKKRLSECRKGTKNPMWGKLFYLFHHLNLSLIKPKIKQAKIITCLKK
jgi:group I intron endonuclease